SHRPSAGERQEPDRGSDGSPATPPAVPRRGRCQNTPDPSTAARTPRSPRRPGKRGGRRGTAKSRCAAPRSRGRAGPESRLSLPHPSTDGEQGKQRGCGASREKSYLRLRRSPPPPPHRSPTACFRDLAGRQPPTRPVQAPPPRPSPRRTRATSGTPRVARQPIPTSGSGPPCRGRSGGCAIAIAISAPLIGGGRVPAPADWRRRPAPPGRRRARRLGRRFPAGRGARAAAMVDILELPKSRINASMLAQFIDKPVCFVGRLEKIHPTGKMFILSDGEGKNGTIELMEPLDEEISGIVEVVGRVTAKATIMCASYVQFKEDNHPFDLGLYNEAVKITHEFPQFFPLGVVQYD
uniref:Replication protein A 14 kDa subunit n=3 Tax=Canis lupus TaxID=9612 RepID=A0A8P0TUV8_CANLF